MSEESDKLALDGRPRFTDIPKLEAITSMPNQWQPRNHTPLGQEPVKLDAKTQAQADAFDIMDQKLNWVGDAVCTLNENLFKVLTVSQEALRLGIVANRRQDDDDNRPYKALWGVARTFALLVITAAVTVLVERYLKHP